MSKKPNRRRPEKADRKATPVSTKPATSAWSAESIRETVESVVIAFILAFLFRTFEAEAFVIPTGSMAPTLMGRHKDMNCPKCGCFFRGTASQEVVPGTSKLTGNWTLKGTCPMCRYPLDVSVGNAEGKKYRSYSGDRILVEKFPYQFRDPERFEVSVFKFPGEAKTNYIKRICGLPNETIRIQHGDLFVKPKGEQQFTITRKHDTKKLLAVLQPVHDTEYVAADLVKLGWPQRWTGDDETPLGSPSAWSSEDHKSFRVDGQSAKEVWLRYQHVPPSHDDWGYLEKGMASPNAPARQLISDFTAYNARESLRDKPGNPYDREYPLSGRGVHWVGDLAIESELNLQSESGEVVFELVEGGRRFQCRVEVATGLATLSIDGDSDFGSPKAETKLKGIGKRDVRFANVDDQLRLWVDGREIEFDAPTTYQPLGNNMPTPADLLPAGVASRGVQMEIKRLRLLRDLYYIATNTGGDPLADYAYNFTTAQGIDRLMSTPADWRYFASSGFVDFELGEGEFLALGDNSGESSDGRIWNGGDTGRCVPRNLLVGKALFIYWPHSENRIPGTSIPCPFFPNFGRMRIIR